MSALILPGRFNQQPQQAGRVDSAHPSAKGLFAAYNFAAGLVNLVDGIPLVPGSAVVASAGQSGIGVGGSGANAYLNFPDYSALVAATGEATILAVLSGGTTADQGLWMIGSQSTSKSSHYPFSGLIYLSDFLGSADNSRWVNGVTPVVPVTQPHIFTVQFKNGQQRAAQNARTLATNTLATAAEFPNGSRLNLSAATGPFFTYSGRFVFVLIWNRYVPDGELAPLVGNPWQLSPAPRRLWAVSGAPAAPTGTFASTLANATLAASGAVANVGAFAATLADAVMAAAGNVAATPSGSIAATLDGATLAASGIVRDAGSFAATLAGVGMSASGTVASNATGTFSTTLAGVSLTASGFTGAAPPPAPTQYRRRAPHRSIQ